MKKYILSAHIVLLTVLLLSACGGGSKAVSGLQGDTLQFKYAALLQVVRYPEYTRVTLSNPWKSGQVLHTYLLTSRDKPQPAHLPEGTVVPVPLQKTLVYSSVHCSVMEELQAADAIHGVCDLSYISLPFIQEKYRKGVLTDAGSSMNPDIEKIISLSPDAILLSPYNNNSGYGRIEKLQIPLIECADYMETSALGRAEWIRFFGMLFGQEERADSIFSEIEKEYQNISRMALSAASRPTVISELKMGNTWYVAGGKSVPAGLFADAGADYIFSHTPQTGSVPMAFETVFDRGEKADFWLIKYNQQRDKIYTELEREYAPYALFKAFKERKIYGCNTKYVPYYEESPFHPERVLKDMVKIFHPEMLKDYQPRYFTPLTE